MLESEFQARLIKRIEKLLPGCIVLKNDPNYRQGFPDLTILHKDHWAVLEVKRSYHSSIRPNQEYWIEKCGEHSFSSFISPETEEGVLDALQRSLETGR